MLALSEGLSLLSQYWKTSAALILRRIIFKILDINPVCYNTSWGSATRGGKSWTEIIEVLNLVVSHKVGSQLKVSKFEVVIKMEGNCS